MKGIVFIKFLEAVKREFGEESVREIIEKSHLPSSGTYEDSGDYTVFEMKLLFHQLSSVCELPPWQILQKSGQGLFQGLFEAYPGFLTLKELAPLILDQQFTQVQFEVAADRLLYLFEKEPSNILTIDWPAPLNEKEIEMLYQDDLEHIQLVFNVFLEVIPKEMYRVDQALDDKDWALLEKIAHKIKPNFAMVGRKAIMEILEQIESHCGYENPDAATIGLLVAKFRRGTTRTLDGVSEALEQFSHVLKQ
ncbi:MAG: hypothetical protein DWQ02_16695 [Bacteroidetes bacterium]|nr:MAG: hypothetical protein DWQ02_16695 [Bacteroidota bacterium]